MLQLAGQMTPPAPFITHQLITFHDLYTKFNTISTLHELLESNLALLALPGLRGKGFLLPFDSANFGPVKLRHWGRFQGSFRS